MRQIQLFLLALSLVLFLPAAAVAQDADVDHFKEGQRLFGEKQFEAALAAFQRADQVVPKEPQIYSWIGACLNELGRYQESKEHLDAAFELLRDDQRRAEERGQPVPRIAIGYYNLLASTQVYLGQYQQAVETIRSVPFEDDGSEGAARVKQGIEGAHETLRARLITVGVECLHKDDLDCARTALDQADVVQPSKPAALEAVARDALAQAERAPAATEEEQAKKAELHETSVKASRLWVEKAGAGSPEAQRLLAKALAATKKKEGYEEAVRILTSLWAGTVEPAQPEGSIQLDLAMAYAGLEQWEPMAGAATEFIEHDPNDPLGQGYCMRSFAEYRQGKCREAIADAQHCKNADGTPRVLAHVDACERGLARQQADRTAANREAELRRECTHLLDRVKWVRESWGEVAVEDLVGIINECKAAEGKCASYFEAAETATPALCGVGVKSASFPLNLSTLSKEELEQLRGRIREFLTLCRPSLDATQAASVEGGLNKVERAIERIQ